MCMCAWHMTTQQLSSGQSTEYELSTTVSISFCMKAYKSSANNGTHGTVVYTCRSSYIPAYMLQSVVNGAVKGKTLQQ